jgi:hypothetical protein
MQEVRVMRILQSEHRVTVSSDNSKRLPGTWETVVEFVALCEAMSDIEWTQHAPKLHHVADEIVRETADLPRPVPAPVQRFLDRCGCPIALGTA